MEQEVGLQIIRKIEFKYEVDLLEEQWFKKHFQRQLSENDVVKLQDVTDIVLFSAPKSIVTRDVVNVLHLPTMEKFLRALIFYCQYYLQISSEMADRILDLHYKIKTKRSYEIEAVYQENLQDLRLLLAKEYCSFIQGAGEYAKYHHSGVGRKLSLTRRDSILFESILRFSIHIVWVALGRKSFQQIELEIQRVFKSNTYNVTKHRLTTDFEKLISVTEHSVLYGSCEREEPTLTIHSPLLNEITCSKNAINYQLFGVADFEYPDLDSRLLYFKNILSASENHLEDLGLSIGIIGLPRCRFDIMLREIKKQSASTSSSSVRKTTSRLSTSKSSTVRSTKSTFLNLPLYPDINLPLKRLDSKRILPDVFPGTIIPVKFQRNKQHLKWLRYVAAKKRDALKNKAQMKKS
ncbi:protein phosphatase 1 regulatory subunit 36-like [Battus philenor]|uniref:protein phosphatase 1 regulatory subunit 36-like n=1 Tax=Battus philenor TaxID=42288 RepID=UPI0035CF0698